MGDNHRLSFNEMAPILKNVTVFSGLNDESLKLICEKCEVLDFDSGTVIIEENTPATEIYILLKGSVAIVLGLREEPFELLRFGCGNCLGEASVIGIQKHSASAITVEKSTLLVLSRSILMEIFEIDKALFSLLILNIARELARRLHHSNELILKYRKGELAMDVFDTHCIYRNSSVRGKKIKI
ncbi:MAG TPA: cyclic nucleotide-binding domain-containing protein [Chitinispirillaceae bacterium]|nr:cyclic nucleotide-binding domain-containing protein [Chitinispirillaceae bacterium]